jgi:cell filamentation protein
MQTPLPGYYNLDHLKRFHYFLFRDVYDWAGETRRVDISKDGMKFAHWRNVDENASALLAGLEDEDYLLGRSQDFIVERLAYYYGELNALHPFREGNGRTQRVLLRQLSVAAGWRLDWSQLSEHRNIEASRRNLISADHAELADLLRPLVSRI